MQGATWHLAMLSLIETATIDVDAMTARTVPLLLNALGARAA